MSELDELRAEVSRLRDELAELRKGVTVHHYHHQVMGQTIAPPPNPYLPQVPYPGWPFPVTCVIGHAGPEVGFNNVVAGATYGPDN